VASTKDPSVGLPLLFVFTAGFSTPVVLAGAAGVEVTLRASNENGGSVSDLVSSLLGAGLVAFGTFTFLEAAFPVGVL
jgi:cytochrome c biogenesis protein CcdA